MKLFAIYGGGEAVGANIEVHDMRFVAATSLEEVATTVAAAKTRAIQSVAGWSDLHRDNMYEAEHIYCLNDRVGTQRLHLHLSRNAETRDIAFTCKYTPVNVND
uniref:hypothetical protein n=1 Tax=Sphingomonas sp. TaxID=28214 RepID=UPI0025E43A6D|nr:hypothetical protein [Sphingomonas sp.]